MNIINNYSKIDEYMPIIKLADNEYVINFDKKDILTRKYKEVNGISVETDDFISSGNCSYKSFIIKKKLTPIQIVNLIQNVIDDETSYNIINLFKWNGYSIYLSKENQMNYKNALDLAIMTNGESLPITFKFKKDGKTAYYTFDTVNELKDFYMAINKHINSCLETGWQRKDAVVAEDYKI